MIATRVSSNHGRKNGHKQKQGSVFHHGHHYCKRGHKMFESQNAEMRNEKLDFFLSPARL
jgi:hypothetical protein